MHPSARQNCEKFIEKYLDGGTVLEVGSMEVSGGGLRSLFSKKLYDYTGLDLREGEGVDVVLDFPYQFPFNDCEFDIVISSSVFEHAVWFWETFAEMVRVVRPGGYIYICAPSTGPQHPGPMDMWRFISTDVWRSLAEWVRDGRPKVQVVESYLDDADPTWNDNVGIFRRL